MEKLARLFDALSHPLRLRIIALLEEKKELYLAEIAQELGVSRALAKIHLKKLEASGLVESRVELEEEKAIARRFYKLKWNGEVRASPQIIANLASKCKGGENE